MITDNGLHVFFISITLISIPSLRSREELSISLTYYPTTFFESHFVKMYYNQKPLCLFISYKAVASTFCVLVLVVLSLIEEFQYAYKKYVV